MAKGTNRRDFLGKALIGAAGAGAVCSMEERILLAALDEETDDGVSSEATPVAPREFPCGQIGDLSMSRLLMGGNLIGGWAHARDLIYVSELFQAYNTEEKIFETLALGEQQGINTIQIDPKCQEVVEKYKRQCGSKLQTMICMRPDTDVARMRDEVKKLVDQGATTLYTHGHFTDKLAKVDDAETLGKALDLIRQEGLKAGIGGHSLKNVMLSEEQNLDPDYYVKTLHMDSYWSATPVENRKEFCWQMGPQPDHDEYHDNIYCLNPKETIEYMQTVKKPWVAFKVLAAGAIPPKRGFSYALRNGADFIIVGMFDFQVVKNVQLAATDIKRAQSRKREWFA
jgi:hypothetical protein